MRRRPRLAGEKRAGEEGLIIALVAVFMLFVIGAIMALSIDVVTFYTARSEAQLAADSAALAGARVLANSGLTSTNGSPGPVGAEPLATQIAQQVATANTVGGVLLTNANVTVAYNDTASTFATDPHITVTVTDTALPTFFARLLGRTQVTVGASATAEAYNPSSANAISTGTIGPPVAPICVKPWLLPNIDPTQLSATNKIFDPVSGYIATTLVGKEWPNPPSGNLDGIYSLCNPDCSTGITGPQPGAFYPIKDDAAQYPYPTQALPSCSAGFTTYQLDIAGCVQTPVACGPTTSLSIDTTVYNPVNTAGRDEDTVQAAACLIHYTNAGDSDYIDTTIPAGNPFEFIAGTQNPVTTAVGKDILVSDSLVTIPVINYPPPPAPTVGNPVITIIGFLQVFLNPIANGSLPAQGPSGHSQYEIPATIINMAGCGTGSTGTPIFGNGASPVAVRLISPP